MSMKGRIKTIIFYASFPKCASDRMNKWLDENPNVQIVDTQYKQARMGDHSIFVVYKEDVKGG